MPIGGGYIVEFIQSARDSEELKYIVDNAIVEYWKKAAYAHLTTFLHARNNGYKNFWNIDADDLKLCAKSRKIAKILNRVKNYSDSNNLDMISLDIWRTFELGAHWSFGLVYTNNSINWIELMKNHCKDKTFFDKYENVDSRRNIDWYCTYLREIGAAKLETFCVENLRMIHHTKFIYTDPVGGLKYWEKGRCYLPVLYDAFNMKDAGSLTIPEDIINFDVGITAEESMRYLKNQCYHKFMIKIEKMNGLRDTEITAILPLNGADKNVRRCLESLLAQNFKDFKLIVTNAGLNNDALKICQEMENSFSRRMKILTVSKEKLFEAGLQAAKGRYIIFISGNEIFTPESFQTLYAVAVNTRADFVHTSNYFVVNDGKTSVATDEQGWGENLQSIMILPNIKNKFWALSKNMLSMSIYNNFIRREFLEEEKISLPFDNEITIWAFNLQCLCLAEKYIRIAHPLYTRLAEDAPKKIPQADFTIYIKSKELSKAAVDKIIEEVLYFDEYSAEINFIEGRLLECCFNYFEKNFK